MKFKLRVKGLNETIARFVHQKVTVSVPDNALAATPRKSTLKRTDGIDTRRVSPVQSKVKLKFVLGILNRQRGILDKAMSKASFDERYRILKLFWEIADSKRSPSRSKIEQLERLCAEIVRRPIVRKAYGPNSMERIREKGFDRYAVDTGRLIKSLRGKYRR